MRIYFQVQAVIVYYAYLFLGTGSCEVGQFRCTDGECIALSMLCDGSTSCSDGSDETDSACHGCPLGQCTFTASAFQNNIPYLYVS